MNTVTKKTVPALANSVKVVVEAVKAFQETNGAGVNAVAVTAIINEHLHDETLFTKAQRPSAVKAINKELGTKLSLTQIKRAVTVARQINPIHVDGLEGTATLPVNEPKAPAAAAPAAVAPSTETGFALVGGVADKAERNQTNNANNTELNQGKTMDTLVSVQRAAKETTTAAAASAPEAVAPVAAAPAAEVVDATAGATVTLAAAPAGATAAALEVDPAKLTAEQYQSVLTQVGATTEEKVQQLVADFFKANPSMTGGFAVIQVQHPALTVKDKFGMWVSQNDAQTMTFLAFAKAWAEPKADGSQVTFTDKVSSALRGNRESGFSSGVVAAAAAVLGGAAEMLSRGSISVGSSVGTLAGATAGYFAANATDELMDSETGRYIVAGSIGAIAGGLGSRLGRTVQDGFSQGAFADDVGQALPDLTRPQAPAPMPAGGSTALLASLF